MAAFAAVRMPALQGRVRQLYRPLNQLYPWFFPVNTGVVVDYGETDDVLRVLEAELIGMRTRIGKPNLVDNVSPSNLSIQTPEDPFRGITG
jgi:hypothetical protein